MANTSGLVKRIEELEREREFYKFLSDLDKKFMLSINDIGGLLSEIMYGSEKITGAESSSLMLVDELTNELYFEVVHGEHAEDIKNIRLKLGEGIVGKVAQGGEPYLTNNASENGYHIPRIDDITGYIPKSILAVPLNYRGNVIGVLEVLDSKKEFTQKHQEMLMTLTEHASIGIVNTKSYSEDPLTGLYNRRYFGAKLDEELIRANRFKYPLSLAMWDIDFFKKVNDRFGHLEGDNVLRLMGSLIKNSVREFDVPARYGGEEFATLFVKANAQEAFNVCDRIREKVGGYNFGLTSKKTDKPYKITISTGIASFLPGFNKYNSKDLINDADKKLYEAKEGGRNKVIC